MKSRCLIGAAIVLAAASLAGAETPGPEMWDEPSHQGVFNHDGLRVVNVNVAPGLTSEFHSHRFATLYVVVQDARIRSQRPDSDWVDLTHRDRRAAGVVADRSDYFASPYLHRVQVDDDRALRLVAVVNERAIDAADEVALADAGERVDNPWFREHRIELGPGASSEPITLANPAVLVQFDAGPMHVRELGVAHSFGTTPGAFSFHPAARPFQVVNDAGRTREFVLIEVRQAD